MTSTLPDLDPRHAALDMLTDHSGQGFHRFCLGPIDLGHHWLTVVVRQDMEPLANRHLAQVLLEPSDTDSAHGCVEQMYLP